MLVWERKMGGEGMEMGVKKAKAEDKRNGKKEGSDFESHGH
jgi:hypothetical protein